MNTVYFSGKDDKKTPKPVSDSDLDKVAGGAGTSKPPPDPDGKG